MIQQEFPFRPEPIPGYRFTVFLNGLVMGYKNISGISREIETESYKEGGLNTKVHIFPKACGKESVLCMEKGVYKGVGHPFYPVGEKLPGVLMLAVTDSFGIPAKSYIFNGLLIKKWEAGDLNAEENSLFIERFEVCYEEFFTML
mgnify:CR=1 FL=1